MAMTQLCIIDVETTGVADDARLVELAAVRIDTEHGVQSVFETLINPGIPIPPESSAIHHITDADVRHAPTPAKVLGDLKFFAQGCSAMVSHPAAFDSKYVTGFGPWICTWRCAHLLLPELPSYSAQALRYRLGLKPALPPQLYPHRALYDAICVASLTMALYQLSPNLVELSTKPFLLYTMPFGKHYGQRFEDIPTEYLRWLIDLQDKDEHFRYTVKHHLDERLRKITSHPPQGAQSASPVS